MKNTNVVDLSEARREMLTIWIRVRNRIIGGSLQGLCVAMLEEDEQEAIMLAGVFKNDPARVLRCALKARSIRAKAQPEFSASRM